MFGLVERAQQLVSLLHSTQCTTSTGDVEIQQAFHLLHNWLYESKAHKGSVFVIGNGGSCGIASHHMVDLVNVLKVKAINLLDNNLLTCMGNDYGYNQVYARPLEVIGTAEDLLIAISSSGNSENILKACDVMKEKNGRVVTFSGFDAKNSLRQKGDLNFWTGQSDYGLVESAHFFILHTIIDGWKSYLDQNKEQQLEKMGIK